jgi:hypothetical protein
MVDQRPMERYVRDQTLDHQFIERLARASDRGGPVRAPHDQLAEQ